MHKSIDCFPMLVCHIPMVLDWWVIAIWKVVADFSPAWVYADDTSQTTWKETKKELTFIFRSQTEKDFPLRLTDVLFTSCFLEFSERSSWEKWLDFFFISLQLISFLFNLIGLHTIVVFDLYRTCARQCILPMQSAVAVVSSCCSTMKGLMEKTKSTPTRSE